MGTGSQQEAFILQLIGIVRGNRCVGSHDYCGPVPNRCNYSSCFPPFARCSNLGPAARDFNLPSTEANEYAPLGHLTSLHRVICNAAKRLPAFDHEGAIVLPRWCVMTSMLLVSAGAALWLILSAAVGNFAETRGHSGTLWYLFSLFCSPVVGFLVVALLPSLARLSRVDVHCPYCQATINIDADDCPVCYRDVVERRKERAAA